VPGIFCSTLVGGVVVLGVFCSTGVGGVAVCLICSAVLLEV
jgi:hypothetical protein